jgi:Phage integrase family
MNRNGWREQFDKRITYLRIDRPKLSTYSLRHSFITRMLDQDVNLFKVQQMVGHRQLSTTAHYTHMTSKNLVRAIRKDSLGRNDLSPLERMLQARKALEDLGFVVIAQKKNDEGQLLLAVSDEQQNAS